LVGAAAAKAAMFVQKRLPCLRVLCLKGEDMACRGRVEIISPRCVLFSLFDARFDLFAEIGSIGGNGNAALRVADNFVI
jgi:hypothetical protein